MPNTYTKIASITGNSLIFSNIPSTYNDLLIVGSVRDLTSGGGAGQTLYMQFNGDGSNVYYSKWMEANGTAQYASGQGPATGFRVGVVNSTGATSAAIFSNYYIYIPQYTSANFKSYISEYATENYSSLAYLGQDVGYWGSTAAITSVSMGTGFAIDSLSTVTLYGIKNT